MTSRMPSEPDASLSLLRRLVDDSMDPGYQEAADRHQPMSVGWRHSAAFAIAIGLTAALVTAAVLQVREGVPSDGRTRSELTDRVVRATALVDELDASRDALAGQADQLRETALNGTAADRTLVEEVTGLEAEVGVAAVEGAGVVVTLKDGPPSPAGDGGPDLARVLDTDIQLVVNGLFAAGAAAVAVNGQRITALSPIRSAGEAVLVGFRPLTPPYTVSAVGPNDLVAAFESSAARTELAQLEATYGIGVDIVAQESVELPGRGDLELRYAKKEVGG
jgi:uncharacterized protein YlxW (UPF0749 family)